MGHPFALLLPTMLLAGCGQELMMTPNLYLRKEGNPYADLSPECCTPVVNVLYATDRVATRTDEKLGVQYGFARSPNLAFGTCDVALGDDRGWDDLMKQCSTQKRSRTLLLSVCGTNELGRFGAFNDLQRVADGRPVTSQPGADCHAVAQRCFSNLLSERLARTERKEVFLYVHGFNNQFYEPAFVIAQIWHFLGRPGVPIFYTWPAGSRGALGYAYDRESGEFTVWHFKQFLREIAAHPDVQRIHIVAHSRGTDVATTALRELHLELGGDFATTRERLKIGNVVLAAADLDLEVTGQRVAAENLLFVPERTTVYLSPDDRALGMAGWLFESMLRLGQLSLKQFTPAQKAALAELPQLSLIQAKVKTDWLGHTYFYSNPAVSSDLILLLRDNRPPGEANGRPLEKLAENFWQIRDDYCMPGAER